MDIVVQSLEQRNSCHDLPELVEPDADAVQSDVDDYSFDNRAVLGDHQLAHRNSSEELMYGLGGGWETRSVASNDRLDPWSSFITESGTKEVHKTTCHKLGGLDCGTIGSNGESGLPTVRPTVVPSWSTFRPGVYLSRVQGSADLTHALEDNGKMCSVAMNDRLGLYNGSANQF